MNYLKALAIIAIFLTNSNVGIIYSQEIPAENQTAAPKAEPVKPIPKAEPITPNETVPRAEIVIPKTYPKAVPNLEFTENDQERSQAILDSANFVYSQKQWSIATAYY